MESKIAAITRRLGVYLLTTLLFFHSSSCNNYFKAVTVTSDFTTTIEEIGDVHKYFIVHAQNRLFHLTEISVDSMNITGFLLPIEQSIQYTEERPTRIRKGEYSILNEVHIYLRQEANPIELGYSDVPLGDVRELRIIDKDNGKTVASHVFGTVGVIAGVLALVTIIVFLTKSSCPYVYVNNGENFAFAGETFGGAIGKNLERDDYMPLPGIKAVDDTYQIRITNELKERQYTDVAGLIVVNHSPEQKVLLDKEGQVQVMEELQAPVEARSYGEQDLTSTVATSDHEKFLFNDRNFSLNGVIFKFNKPDGARSGKLLIDAKNTLWFDYVFGEFLQKFGSNFNSHMTKQSKIPTSDRMQTVRDNNFPLSIYAKQNGQWQLVDYLMTVGPLANREFVLPIDLEQYPGDEIELKVETGFMFWEVDRFAMDFSTTTDADNAYLHPISATGANGENWTTALQEADEQYMPQEEVGDLTQLTFAVPTVPEGQVQSVFLHTRGYYELIRDFKGLPKLVELNKFKDSSYFSDYSRAGYLKVLNREEEIEALKIVSR